MRESNFNTELRRALDRLSPAWSYKIPDAPFSRTMSQMRFAPEKPFDIAAMIAGRGFAIESKLMKKWASFGMKDLRKSQIRNLFLFHRAAKSPTGVQVGFSLVALNVRIPNEPIRFLFFRFDYLQLVESIPAARLKTLPFCAYEGGELILKSNFWSSQCVGSGLSLSKTRRG